jgi:DNA-binding transcriptional MerR regulator
MHIFEISEVAQVVGLPQSRVKFWTIGKPLLISPSIRTALGRGARNLYSLDDVHLMALAKELIEAGMPSPSIQKVLDVVRNKLGEWDVENSVRGVPGPEPTLRDVGKLRVILHGEGDEDDLSAERGWHQIRLGGSPTVRVVYELDAKEVAERVNDRLNELSLEQPLGAAAGHEGRGKGRAPKGKKRTSVGKKTKGGRK